MTMPLSASFPDLTALDLFTTVIEVGSLGKAAKVHGIAQPSVSSRIRNLERQLGVTLLERTTTGCIPTSDGIVVSGWADEILRAAHDLEAGLIALKAEQSGQLRIAASYTIAEYLLPAWLGRFAREHPRDAVSLDVENSTNVLSQLERGEADVGFIETPTATPSMDEVVVGHDQLIAVVPPGHPWAKSRFRVSLEELAKTPLVMREKGSGTREALEQALANEGHGAPVSVLELGSTSAVRSAVLTGNSPTVISRLAVAAEVESGQLIEARVTGLKIERDLRAVWPANRSLPKLAAALLDDIG